MLPSAAGRPRAILLDLLMATMDSISVWTSAAGDRHRGLAWRDAVTTRMIEAGRYVAYDDLVVETAGALGLPEQAPERLRAAWSEMRRWPDADVLESAPVPIAFVTNCSAGLAETAVQQSGFRPSFTLSAEEAGWYKPQPAIYRMACDLIGLPAGQVRYVAGAAYDARGAAAVGFRTTLVARRPLTDELPAEVAVARSLDAAIRAA